MAAAMMSLVLFMMVEAVVYQAPALMATPKILHGSDCRSAVGLIESRGHS